MFKILILAKSFILLGLLGACAVLQAQDVDDEDSVSLPFPYPETGAWSQQNDSNTGFFIEIQNGRVAAAYFGFDGQGDDAWVIFAGDLEPLLNDNPDRNGWRLSAPLLRFVDGGCILDCQNVSDSMASNAQVGQIVIDFTGRSVATFSVDGAEPSQIVPMAFGSGGFVEFPEASDLLLPVLTGRWISNFPVPFADPQGSLEYVFGDRSVTDNGIERRVSYPVEISSGASGVNEQQTITAETLMTCSVNVNSSLPICIMELPPELYSFVQLGGVTNAAIMRLEDFSDSRISFEINFSDTPPSPNGIVFSLFRVNYD